MVQEYPFLAKINAQTLFLSMEEIMTNENGKQVSSGDMSVDWVVKGLINQEMRMRGETDKVDAKIAA